jgi:DNA-binding response OmpR family regulator
MTTAETEENKRILIVDDEPAVLKLLKTLLTRAHYRVVTCGSGDEALKHLSQASFDMMITDAIMPKMTGFDLVMIIRRNATFQELPILMLTRRNERSDVKKALEAGVTDYVLKPIDEFLLLEKVGISLKTNDQNRLREVLVHGDASRATMNIETRIISLRESGMTVRIPFAVPSITGLQIQTSLFKEIGIGIPMLKARSCELKFSTESQLFADFPYEVEFTFAGVTEPDLKKIRAWLQRQEIQRKK